jgi:hypothetical protein
MRRLWAGLAVATLSIAVSPAYAATGTSDWFDRSDGALGSTATGLAWNTANSSWGVRGGMAKVLTTRYADTIAYAFIDIGASIGFTVAADVTLSSTFQRANGGLAILYASPANNIFCKTEVTHGNPNGLISIGRRLNGRTTSLLAYVNNAGLANGRTYHVTCGRAGNVVTMTVGGTGVGPITISKTLSSSELSAFGSATRVGLRSHVNWDEDDKGTGFDNFVVTFP